jgi:hypothetical protein
MSANLVSNVSRAAANPQVISLSGKTNGRTLFAWFIVGATPTLPSGWVEDQSLLAGTGTFYTKLWRLPAAANTAAVTQLSVALNGASPLAGVIWQDDVTTTGMYSAIAEQDPTTDTPALHGTGLHTFPARKETFALFAVYTKGFTSDFTLFDYTAFDNSYSDFGDSGNAGGTSANAVHAWAPRRQNASMTANGVTATANQAGNVGYDGVSGMVAYDTITGPSGNAPSNTSAPHITPLSAQTGAVLTCAQGTWTGDPTITYAYQWRRAAANIAAATASTYTAQVADEGQAITCAVTATNSAGSATSTSDNTVPPAAPSTGGGGGGGGATVEPAIPVRLYVPQGGAWTDVALGNARVVLWDAAAHAYIPSVFLTDTSLPREFIGPTDPSTIPGLTLAEGDRWTPTAGP